MRYLLFGLWFCYQSALAQTGKTAREWFDSAVVLMRAGLDESTRGMKFYRDKETTDLIKVYRFVDDNPVEVAGRTVLFYDEVCVSDVQVGLPLYRDLYKKKNRGKECFGVSTADISRFFDLLATSQAHVPPATPKPTDNQHCEAWQSALPADYHRVDVELVAGAGHELPQDFQIKDDFYSGGITYHTKLNVHYPEQAAVVLVLKSYYPNVWDIATAGSSNIKALYLTGYHQSTVIGLTNDIPVLRHSYDVPRCQFGYGGTPSGMKPAAESIKITRQSAYSHEQGLVLGHDAADWVRAGHLDSVRKMGKLDGSAGLEQLVAEGALVPMSSHQAARFFGTAPTGGDHIIHGYLIKKGIDLPEEMYGGHSTYFYIPNDVPIPQGDFGHNTFFLPSGLCWGAICH